MKVLNTEEFIKMANPTPGETYRHPVVTVDDKAEALSGIMAVYVAGSQGDYHYHENCDSLMVIISGEAVELVEGKEIPLKAGDLAYIPAGEKHTVINRSDKDFRFFEFFTRRSDVRDFRKVE